MTPGDLHSRIARIGSDRESGASALHDEVLAVLRDALTSGDSIQPIATALLQAQPSMAPVWTAVGEALAAQHDPKTFERYCQRIARAPRALVRHAVPALLTGNRDAPIRVVTISFSGTVLAVLMALAAEVGVEVACAEGRPALEGRRLAERLAVSGTHVTFYSDAALGHAIAGADAVIVGADAITPDWFLNKSGTRMLAAAAAQHGLPVYVLATQDKFVSRAVAACLKVREESPAEIWPSPPPGVTVRNPYFERTPLDLVAAVISDTGVLGAGMVIDACPTTRDDVLLGLVG